MIETYKNELKQLYRRKQKLRKTAKVISYIRFLFFLLSLGAYFYIKNTSILFTALLVIGIVFGALVRVYKNISSKIAFVKNLIALNDEEIAFLNGNPPTWDPGEEFIDPKHAYTYDLDVFGKNSLFQHINRVHTYIGKIKLAELFLNKLPIKKISSTQEAIAELAQKFNWRQSLQALARSINDNKEGYLGLINWVKRPKVKAPKILMFCSYFLPLITWMVILMAIYTKDTRWNQSALLFFSFNILLIITQIKRIKSEMISFDKIHQIIRKYALVVEHIERESFDSSKLKDLQEKSFADPHSPSREIKKLSCLFEQLESIHNPMGMAIINGLLLYHLHVLRKILKWKEKYSSDLEAWIENMGKFEALGSLANFFFNHPDFTFPKINDKGIIAFNDMGHPLIDKNNAVYNSIDFNDHSFVILTGSNMSGKSTFLRTLGINMLLTNIGAPVCARSAEVQPLPICACMRLSDSLHEGESYFFAEIKRLQMIVASLKDELHFVLLDEILRGTNSEDKRLGTVGMIKKMLQNKALGIIATHDLEVCGLSEQYNELINKCFEAKIENHEISFDYRLREGICKNKSATFLMKKWNVI